MPGSEASIRLLPTLGRRIEWGEDSWMTNVKFKSWKIRLNHVVVIQIFREIELVLPERENVKLMNANNCVWMRRIAYVRRRLHINWFKICLKTFSVTVKSQLNWNKCLFLTGRLQSANWKKSWVSNTFQWAFDIMPNVSRSSQLFVFWPLVASSKLEEFRHSKMMMALKDWLCNFQRKEHLKNFWSKNFEFNCISSFTKCFCICLIWFANWVRFWRRLSQFWPLLLTQ